MKRRIQEKSENTHKEVGIWPISQVDDGRWEGFSGARERSADAGFASQREFAPVWVDDVRAANPLMLSPLAVSIHKHPPRMQKAPVRHAPFLFA